MFPMMTYSSSSAVNTETISTGGSSSDSTERLNEIRDEFRIVTPIAASTDAFHNENLFQYTRIINQSPSVDSKVDFEIFKPMLQSQQTTEPAVIDVTKRFSDQKLPTTNNNKSPSAQSVKSFVYVNKNGYAKLIQADLNETKEAARGVLNTSQDQYQSVPMGNLNQTIGSNGSSSNNNTFVHTNQNGQIVQINTSAMVNDEYVDIKHDHVRMLSLMAILCCWCFPFTGIPALFYTRLMKKFYRLNDMVRAKRYLIKSERLVLLTFFFGFTLIAILFAILQIYFFDAPRALMNNSTEPWEPSHRYFMHH